MEPETMARDLVALKPFLHFETLFLLGGEPTLHPKLKTFMALAKTSGVANKTGVITNGRLLPKMDESFWHLLDVLRLSIYPGLPPEILALCQAKQEKHQFIFEPMVFDEFYKQFKKEPDDGVESFKNCPWKTSCYTVHEGKFYLCPQSTFFPKLFQGKESADGLPLADLTEEKLAAFLDRTDPLETCRICCGGHTETLPWRESKTREEWLRDSTITS